MHRWWVWTLAAYSRTRGPGRSSLALITRSAATWRCLCIHQVNRVNPTIAVPLPSVLLCTHRLTRREGTRRARSNLPNSPPPKKKKSGKYFSGNYYVNFGHFVNFSYIYFRMYCPPPKLTELLHLRFHACGFSLQTFSFGSGLT